MRLKRAHKNLNAWKEAVTLATHVYRITDNFPKAEIYGIVSQMRRAAVSIPSNIAEGAARSSSREFLRFLSIASGSLSELDTQCEIAFNLKYLTEELKNKIDNMTDSLGIKIAGLVKNLKGRLK